MITATDSFLQFLHTELSSSLTVKWVRPSTADENSSTLAHDALNVGILGFSQDGSVEEVLVSLDLIASDARQALTWASQVRDVLRAAQFIPEYDYSDPDVPVALGRMVFWEGDDVEFALVAASTNYYHLNATFSLSHVNA